MSSHKCSKCGHTWSDKPVTDKLAEGAAKGVATAAAGAIFPPAGVALGAAFVAKAAADYFGSGKCPKCGKESS